MQRERRLSVLHEPSETDYLIRSPSLKIQDYLERFFALPEALREGQTDHEQNAWRRLLTDIAMIDGSLHSSVGHTPMRLCFSR